MLGTDEPFKLDSMSYSAIWNAFDLNEKKNIEKEFSFIASDELLRKELKYYPINTDWKPFTEYFMATNYRTSRILRKCNDLTGGVGTVAKACESNKDHKVSFVYRSAFETIESEFGSDSVSGNSLPDELIINKGTYNVFGKGYLFNRQGLYRFSSRSAKHDIQRIVFSNDLDTLVSSLAWICTHSEKDDNLDNLQKTEVAKYRKLSTLCGSVSGWVKYILESKGFKVRMVMGITLEEWGVDNGHTMIEALNPRTNKWQLFDITNNCMFSRNGTILSFLDFYKVLQEKGQFDINKLATDSQYDYSGFSTQDEYYYTLGAERISTENSLRKWYCREFQVALIEDKTGFKYFNDKTKSEQEKIYSNDKALLPMDTIQFINQYYKSYGR